MGNQQPTPEDLEAYQRVNAYLNRTGNKSDNRFSIIPDPKWLWIIIIAIVAFSTYYGITTLLFGQDFWITSIMGNP